MTDDLQVAQDASAPSNVAAIDEYVVEGQDRVGGLWM